jgi:hypothetical protein
LKILKLKKKIEMLKFKEITKNFFKELVENPRAFCCFRPIHHYRGDPIIDNIFFIL